MDETARRHRHVVNEGELDWASHEHGSKFGFRSKRLGAAAGGEKMGASLFEVAPGRRAFPFHAHTANEEAIYVLEGEGLLRIGADEVRVRAGDYIALPPRLDLAHQLINNSSHTLRYLCLSTQIIPEICTYPDSNKVGYLASPRNAPPTEQLRRVVPRAYEVDYYEGED